jgi:tetratricopeptide (TPR) repeat protein
VTSRWGAGLLALLLAGTAVAALAASRLEEGPEPGAPASLLYLPKGPYLRLTALGQENLLADLLYLWAIQYYSTYEAAERYRYLEAVFSDAITELDPHYVDVYCVGALIMSIEAGDSAGALRHLDKGIRHNPDSWLLPYVAGWEAYIHGQYDRASRYFDRVRSHPDAPPHMERVYAAVLGKGGHSGQALREWWLVRRSTEDPYVLGVADRWIRRLTTEVLERAVSRFADQRGHRPRRLADLGDTGFLEQALLPPDWRSYRYHPEDGVVRPPEVHVVAGAR